MSFRDNSREAFDFTDMEQKELAAKTGISLKTIESYVKKRLIRSFSRQSLPYRPSPGRNP
jgi:DNA-binding XRE family transcriptional regulator